jgi:hypothetical protein
MRLSRSGLEASAGCRIRFERNRLRRSRHHTNAPELRAGLNGRERRHRWKYPLPQQMFKCVAPRELDFIGQTTRTSFLRSKLRPVYGARLTVRNGDGSHREV